MKIIKYTLFVLALSIAFISCSDDDKTIFDPNNAKAGELLPIAGSDYVLLAENYQQKVESFKWGAMDFGYQAAINYIIEVDLKGKDFANAQSVTSSNGTTADATVQQLNTAMLALQKVYKFQHETAQDVEFRVRGSISDAAESVYSTNSITASVTPYFEYPKVWVIGQYCGWDHGKSQFLFEFDADNNPDVYSGWVRFGDAQDVKDSGFKITGVGNWDDNDKNWGAESENFSPGGEPKELQLMASGDSKNIVAYHNAYYKFSFNTKTLLLTKSASMNNFGITGSAILGNSDAIFEFDSKTQEFLAPRVTLKDGEIKFRADGADGELTYGQGAGEGKLSVGGAGISVAAGTYEIRVNLNNDLDCKFTIEGAEPLNPDLITPQELKSVGDYFELAQLSSKEFSWEALDFGAQDQSTVTYTLQMDVKGGDFSNPQVIGTTDATNVSVGGAKLLELLKALDASVDLDIEKEIDLRVVAKVSGLEDLFISNVESTKVKIIDKAMLFMIGDEFGGWDWDSSEVVEMIPVNGGNDKQYWAIKYITQGKGFKWNTKRGWGGDFPSLNENAGFDVANGNASVKESGLYMIFVDFEADKITIEPAKVYGMGDVFGSWNMGDHPFALSADGKTMNFTAAGSGELRMYAKSSAFDTDWWKMEFVVIDGKIEYRGDGGDQQRVNVDKGQKITLDFASNTGKIE